MWTTQVQSLEPLAKSSMIPESQARNKTRVFLVMAQKEKYNKEKDRVDTEKCQTARTTLRVE